MVSVQVVEEQVGRRGEAVHPLTPVLHRTLADVQERLTFRAQAFIKVGVFPFLVLSASWNMHDCIPEKKRNGSQCWAGSCGPRSTLRGSSLAVSLIETYSGTWSLLLKHCV